MSDLKDPKVRFSSSLVNAIDPDFKSLTDKVFQEKLARDEAEVLRMLGKWVSECEPTLLYRGTRLVGLGLKDQPIGDDVLVVVEAWVE